MNTDRKISDLDLEKFALGEISDARAREIERAIGTDPEVASRLAAIHSSTDKILKRYPPRVMAAAIEQRSATADRPKPLFTPGRVLVPAALLGAVALAFSYYLSSVTPERIRPALQETIILKGDTEPTLSIYRKGVKKEEPLKPRDRVAEGDVLQVRYAARGARFGVIFSVDGRGQVTLHFPSSHDASTKLLERGTHTLAFSYELDDAPEFERFFFVTGDHPLSTEKILEAARSLGTDVKAPLVLPGGYRQTDFPLLKTRSH